MEVLRKIFNILTGTFLIIFGLGLIVGSIIGTVFISLTFSLMVLVGVLGGGFILHAGVGMVFFHNEDYSHLLCRRMWGQFIGCVAYALCFTFYLLAEIYLIVLGVFDWVLIMYAIFAAVGIFVYLLLAAHTRQEYKQYHI